MRRVRLTAKWGTRRDWRWLWLRRKPRIWDLGTYELVEWEDA